jgi:hypothetical protein
VGAAKQAGGADRRRQRVPPRPISAEPPYRVELPHCGIDGAAEVGGLRVEGAVDHRSHVTHNPTFLVGQPAALRADRAQCGSHGGGGAHRDHRPRQAHSNGRGHLEDGQVLEQAGRGTQVANRDLQVRRPFRPIDQAERKKGAAQPAPAAAGALSRARSAGRDGHPVAHAPCHAHASCVTVTAVCVQDGDRAARRNRARRLDGSLTARRVAGEAHALEQRRPAVRQRRQVRRQLGDNALGERPRTHRRVPHRGSGR